VHLHGRIRKLLVELELVGVMVSIGYVPLICSVDSLYQHTFLLAAFEMYFLQVFDIFVGFL
jgi:hypothetical protein